MNWWSLSPLLNCSPLPSSPSSLLRSSLHFPQRRKCRSRRLHRCGSTWRGNDLEGRIENFNQPWDLLSDFIHIHSNVLLLTSVHVNRLQRLKNIVSCVSWISQWEFEAVVQILTSRRTLSFGFQYSSSLFFIAGMHLISCNRSINFPNRTLFLPYSFLRETQECVHLRPLPWVQDRRKSRAEWIDQRILQYLLVIDE